MVGTGVGARLGVLIKGGAALETAHQTSVVLFDKTGTLTLGAPALADVVVLPPRQGASATASTAPSSSDGAPAWSLHVIDMLSLIASAESNSEHPLGRAIVEGAERVAAAISRPTVGDAPSAAPTRDTHHFDVSLSVDGYPLVAAAADSTSSTPPSMRTSLAVAPCCSAAEKDAGQQRGRSSSSAPFRVIVNAQGVGAAAPTPRFMLRKVDPDTFMSEPGFGLRADVAAAATTDASVVAPRHDEVGAGGTGDAPGGEPDVQRHVVVIGNRAWMARNSVDVPPSAEAQLARLEDGGRTAVVAAIDGVAVAVLGLADRVRPEAGQVVLALRGLGIDVWMVTGDTKRAAASVASAVHIPPSRVLAGVLPAGKAAVVEDLQHAGAPAGGPSTAARRVYVAFVGDGVNDSPALATADVGMAVGAGAQIAVAAASIVLVRSDLRDVVTALHLSRAVFNRIRLNFGWALGYNVLGIPLAAGVFFPLMHTGVPPEVAGLAMALSSTSVVLSSLMLKRYVKPDVEAMAARQATIERDRMGSTRLATARRLIASAATRIAGRFTTSRALFVPSTSSGALPPSSEVPGAVEPDGGDETNALLGGSKVDVVNLAQLTPPCACSRGECSSNKLDTVHDWRRAWEEAMLARGRRQGCGCTCTNCAYKAGTAGATVPSHVIIETHE